MTTEDTGPRGVHTCQTGRGKGISGFTLNDAWSCPLCGDHGPGVTAEQVTQRDAEMQAFINELADQTLARLIAEDLL